MVVGYLLIKSNGSLFTEYGKLQGEIAISQERDFDGFWFSKEISRPNFQKSIQKKPFRLDDIRKYFYFSEIKKIVVCSVYKKFFKCSRNETRSVLFSVIQFNSMVFEIIHRNSSWNVIKIQESMKTTCSGVSRLILLLIVMV